jgi:Ca2+/Na+ antiporter
MSILSSITQSKYRFNIDLYIMVVIISILYILCRGVSFDVQK